MLNHLIQMKVKDKKIFNVNPVTKEFFGVLVKNVNGRYTLNRTNDVENKENPNIVIVLESPHRSEYDKKGDAIRSANGTSGSNLSRKLDKKINTAIDSRICTLNGFEYNVYAVNAIQYQCSLGLKPIQTELRNTIFRTFWPSLKGDFINRISQLKPVLIINMCTGGTKAMRNYISNTANMQKAEKYFKNLLSGELPLNLMVHLPLVDYVSANINVEYYYCAHPSARYFSTCKLKKI